MNPTILITGRHSEHTLQRLQALPGCRLIFAQTPNDLDPAVLADVEIFVGFIRPEMAQKMPLLRFVQLFSAGANGYGWLPKEVILANAYGAYGDSIAEHMLTTTLMAMKRMPEYQEMQKRQGWELLDDIVRMEGSNVLSVGMGAIGTSYLRKVATPDEMDALLPEMDVVALSLPGTDAVAGMFDARRLCLMKKSAILVNVGRGNSVVTSDLVQVMQEGHLRAACLDVMDPEPLPPDHPLWTTPRVYLTPHISGGYRAGVNYDRVIDVVVQNLNLVLQGKPPIHIVDRELGY